MKAGVLVKEPSDEDTQNYKHLETPTTFVFIRLWGMRILGLSRTRTAIKTMTALGELRIPGMWGSQEAVFSNNCCGFHALKSVQIDQRTEHNFKETQGSYSIGIRAAVE